MRHAIQFQAGYDLFANPISGFLTDEHAASSYGLPVIVDAAGKAYGPADVGFVAWNLEATPEFKATECNVDFAGQKWTDESNAILDAARRAGYSV